MNTITVVIFIREPVSPGGIRTPSSYGAGPRFSFWASPYVGGHHLDLTFMLALALVLVLVFVFVFVFVLVLVLVYALALALALALF